MDEKLIYETVPGPCSNRAPVYKNVCQLRGSFGRAHCPSFSSKTFYLVIVAEKWTLILFTWLYNVVKSLVLLLSIVNLFRAWKTFHPPNNIFIKLLLHIRCIICLFLFTLYRRVFSGNVATANENRCDDDNRTEVKVCGFIIVPNLIRN